MGKIGRPNAQPGTVRISEAGVIRLSPDLCIGDSFYAKIEEKEITLIRSDEIGGLRVFKSAEKSQSKLMSAMKVFRVMGIKPETIAGVYPAKVVDGERVVIDLRKRVGL